jgi:hypothetical protein
VIHRRLWLLGSLAASVLLACTTGQTADPWLDSPAAPSRFETPAHEITSATVAPSREPKDVVELFATRILPTCSLNNGVCHNANNYPDLRNVATIADLVGLPCGRDAAIELRDECEPPGDRLVADGPIDVVVERVSFDAAASVATITTGADVPSGTLTGVEIRRGRDSRVLAASAAGATFAANGRRTVTASLESATAEARTFFEPKLPLREDRIWAADVNGNGVAGATSGWREIVPGRPDRSYLVARLWDEELDPQLMPRQCRNWDDTATRALGCWIENLRTDERGTPTNFFAPIDYARCRFVVPRGGRCGSGQ